MATRKKKFFYIILTDHYFKVGNKFKQRLGYGVTDHPGQRIRKYSNTSGGEQEFCNLYFSPNFEVMEIEKILKQRLADDCHTINGEEVEWVSPYSDIDLSTLISMVNNIIKELRLNVKKIKDEFLPFKSAEWQKEINRESIETNPNSFLQDINA
jgi:hypothetical protein